VVAVVVVAAVAAVAAAVAAGAVVAAAVAAAAEGKVAALPRGGDESNLRVSWRDTGRIGGVARPAGLTVPPRGDRLHASWAAG